MPRIEKNKKVMKEKKKNYGRGYGQNGVTKREGQTMIDRMRRIMELEEPITDGAPIVYTPRSEGVKPEYNIRTDRWDMVIEYAGLNNKNKRAKRQTKVESLGEQTGESTGVES